MTSYLERTADHRHLGQRQVRPRPPLRMPSLRPAGRGGESARAPPQDLRPAAGRGSKSHCAVLADLPRPGAWASGSVARASRRKHQEPPFSGIAAKTLCRRRDISAFRRGGGRHSNLQAVMNLEAPLSHQALQIPVGGRQHPHVQAQGLVVPHPLNDPVLQKTQQLGLA